MVNIHKKKSQEAKSELTKSGLQWGVALVMVAVATVLIFVGSVIVSAGNGCQAGSEKVNEGSEKSEQRAHEKGEKNNSEGEKAAKKEKVDSDSISITSSEDDGEIVDVVA